MQKLMLTNSWYLSWNIDPWVIGGHFFAILGFLALKICWPDRWISVPVNLLTLPFWLAKVGRLIPLINPGTREKALFSGFNLDRMW